MKVLVSGYLGHMGKILSEMIRNDEELELVAGVDKGIATDEEKKTSMDGYLEPVFSSFNEVSIKADIIVDFSHHSLTKDLTEYATKNSIPIVVATTGQTEEEKNMIIEASKKIPVFFAANYSMGIAVLIDEAKNIVKKFKDADVEIIETHHNRKIDAPSGTALKIANELKSVKEDANLVMGRNGNQKREKKDIGISAVRMGNVVGIHEVLISTEHECISIKHEAYDRGLFAEGAIRAIKFMKDKTPGLYDMKNLLG